MPLIEGLGDEVTLVLGGFLLCVVLMLAWFSTHTSEIPLLREVGVIVVELSQRRNRATPVGENRERSSPEGEDNSAAHHGGQDGGQGNVAAPDQAMAAQGDGGEGNAEGSIVGASVSSSQRDGSNVDLASYEERDSSTLSSGESSKPQQSGAANKTLLLPEAAEMVTAECERQRKAGGDDSGDREQDCVGENVMENTESPIPPASTVLDESGKPTDPELPDRPSEEEMRRRRVQYFQTSQSASVSDTPDSLLGEGAPFSLQTNSLSAEVTNASAPQSTYLCDSTGIAKQPLTNSSPTANVSSDVEGHQRLSGGADRHVASDAGDVTASGLMGADDLFNETHDEPPGDSQSSQIRVKLKYMNETQRLVYASPLDTIGDFRRTHFQPELEENKWVRFIYNGQDLRDDARTLQACNIGDNCTMHCLITARTRPAASIDVVGDEEVEDSVLGALMYPLFTLVLLVVWYFRFTYRQYFSAMSTVVLIGISFLLALSYVSSLRSSDTAQQRQQQQPAAAGGRQQQQQNHPHAD